MEILRELGMFLLSMAIFCWVVIGFFSVAVNGHRVSKWVAIPLGIVSLFLGPFSGKAFAPIFEHFDSTPLKSIFIHIDQTREEDSALIDDDTHYFP